MTVCSVLRERAKLDSIGGQEFVLNIVEDQASSANVYYYGKQVKDKASMREILRTAQEVVQEGMGFTGKTEDFIQGVESKFFKLTNEAKTQGMVKLQSCLKENLKDLEDMSRKPEKLQESRQVFTSSTESFSACSQVS